MPQSKNTPFDPFQIEQADLDAWDAKRPTLPDQASPKANSSLRKHDKCKVKGRSGLYLGRRERNGRGILSVLIEEVGTNTVLEVWEDEA